MGEKLTFDGVEIGKSVIREKINTELNTLIEARIDQLRDGVPNIINRFQSNRTNAKKQVEMVIQKQIIDAVQLKIFAVNINPELEKSDQQEILYRIYTKTFRISRYTTINDLLVEACEFWGLLSKEFSIFVAQGSDEFTNLKDE